MAKLTTSAIMTVPHDLLDLRSAGDTHVEQCLIIEVRQGRDRLFDLSFPPPILPEGYNPPATRSEPMPTIWLTEFERIKPVSPRRSVDGGRLSQCGREGIRAAPQFGSLSDGIR
jgi:hypothetical protein